MSNQVTRVIAVNNLQKYLGKDLYLLALEHGVTVFKGDNINKGWKGHVLELLSGLENNSKKAPNGLGFELKSVSFIKRNGLFVPKETMAITMINKHELLRDSFYESHCWSKLKSLVFCAVEWKGTFAKSATLISVTSFDFFESHAVIKEIEDDYELIRRKLHKEGFEALTGRDGKWIQARTKGAGHGSTSRAFYARKNLVAAIFNDSKTNISGFVE